SPPRLVPPGVYQRQSQTGEQYLQQIDPVVVGGYDYPRYPGLLISEETMRRLGLFVEEASVAHYILTPVGSPLTAATVRTALPNDLAGVADVIVNQKEETSKDLESASRAVAATSSILVFLISVLLVLTWSSASTDVLRTLTALGMKRYELTGVLIARGVRVMAPAILGGIVLSLGLTLTF